MPATILYNGTIYTLDPSMPRAQALGIRDGRVVVVGSEGKVQAAMAGRAEPINLRGRAVIPALTDAHVHFIGYALTRRELRLDGVADFDDALRRAGAAASQLLAGAWLLGGGWDHTLWGGRWPRAADLDALTPDRPALLLRKDGHSAWANSQALALAGIDDTTPDPPGGTIQREKKRATGILLEHAIDLVRAHIPATTQADRLAAMRAAFVEAHSYGMAGVHVPPGLTAGDGTQLLSDLQALRERGELALRCLAHISLERLDEALRLGLRSGLGDRWLRVGGIKIFADGSLGSETAEMLSHYEGRRHLGTPTITRDELNDAVARANGGGLAVAVHAIGDAANRSVLDAIELATQLNIEQAALSRDLGEPGAQFALGNAPLAIPNRIEHCQIIHPTDIPRFAALGVIASMQPIHATSDMELADRLWGERCAHAYAWHALQAAGAVLAFGSDAPVEPLNPWLSVHAAVTRQRPGGQPPGGWYAEQCLDITSALRGFTIGPAIAAGAGHEQGTLMPGKLADLAILSADPFKISPADMHVVNADLTMIEGEVRWTRP